MINKEIITSTEVMPLEKAKEMGAMALFSEKYADVVRVVKIGKSIELCGGTHVANTKEIGKLAIYSCESKGSNVYRIEAVTGDRIESTLAEVIRPYNDEKVKLLMKAKEILENARNNGLKLEFDVDLNNDEATSYKDIIFNRTELQYVHHEVKELEKEYNTLKEKSTLQNLNIYRDNIREINGINSLVMKVFDKDNNILKSVMDTIINEISEGVVFFANVCNNEKVSYLVKSSSKVDAGQLVKLAAALSNGNGGGSKTFAQGGSKDISNVDIVLEKVVREISDYE